jgi:hypothetical protein
MPAALGALNGSLDAPKISNPCHFAEALDTYAEMCRSWPCIESEGRSRGREFSGVARTVFIEWETSSTIQKC